MVKKGDQRHVDESTRCPEHGRWTRLLYADGTTRERPCPECPPPEASPEQPLFFMPELALMVALAMDRSVPADVALSLVKRVATLELAAEEEVLASGDTEQR